MGQKSQKMQGDSSGFTLIELLIVVVVLGILAAVVVLSLGGVTSNAGAAACENDVQAVNTAAQAYHSSSGAYPTSTAQLVGAGNYLQSWPNNPSFAISLPASPSPSTWKLLVTSVDGTVTYGTFTAASSPAQVCALP